MRTPGLRIPCGSIGVLVQRSEGSWLDQGCSCTVERRMRRNYIRARSAAPARHTSQDGWQRAASHRGDRKSTRLNSSHANISYAVFCLKKKGTTALLGDKPLEAY